jgi:hypothetical protein
MTERVLETVVEERPEDVDMLFYKAELYQRRGELEQAEEVYQQVLASDPEYAQTYLRLGTLVEEQSSREAGEARGRNLAEAAAWYGRYHEVAPDDLLGLKRLVGVCETLEELNLEDQSCRAVAERERTAGEEIGGQKEGRRGETSGGRAPAAVLGEALTEHTDDRRIVAELLGVRMEDVELGPNLVKNGGFEVWAGKSPRQWTWAGQFSQEIRSSAVFVGGSERLSFWEGQAAARLDGLWVQDQKGKEPARAGFWWHDTIDLTARGPYVISFEYRTRGSTDEGMAVWLTGSDDVLWSHNHRVPATDGSWHRFVAVGWNDSRGEGAIRPLLRSYVTGTATFDNMQVRAVEATKATRARRRETIFLIGGSAPRRGTR